MKAATIDVTKKYGLLTPVAPIGKNKHGKTIWKCLCDCGNSTETLAVYLRNGNTNSCGCYGRSQRIKSVTKHGASRKLAEYEIWKGMRARCYNSKHSSYDNYGGKGIKVCERWDDFNLFILDMGRRPSVNYSIDRYPNIDGNYEPDNCRWATTYQQSRNKSNNRWFVYKEEKMILADWAKRFSVDPSTLCEHLRTKTFNEIISFYQAKLTIS